MLYQIIIQTCSNFLLRLSYKHTSIQTRINNNSKMIPHQWLIATEIGRRDRNRPLRTIISYNKALNICINPAGSSRPAVSQHHLNLYSRTWGQCLLILCAANYCGVDRIIGRRHVGLTRYTHSGVFVELSDVEGVCIYVERYAEV